MKAYLEKLKVHHYYIRSEVKASPCERLIYTITQRIQRYLTEKNNFRYINILNDVVDSYNDTKHRIIGK